MTDIYLPCLGAVEQGFPPAEEALAEPNGLLAFGGDLTRERLLDAYRLGIFPWYSEGQPLLWWSPDPRMVLYPGRIHISRSLKKSLAKEFWRVTVDKAFDEVISACASPRPYADDTWITGPMRKAYRDLNLCGYAHSVEVWNEDGSLAGGLYGIAMGKVFFGESMFSKRNNASKVALVKFASLLLQKSYTMIDCQVSSEFLAGLGATEIPRTEFERHLPGTEIPPPDLLWPEECFNSKT